MVFGLPNLPIVLPADAPAPSPKIAPATSVCSSANLSEAGDKPSIKAIIINFLFQIGGKLIAKSPILQRIFGRNRVPGPLLARLSTLWKSYHLVRGTYAKAVKDLHLRFGTIVQIGPREFSLSSESAIDVTSLGSPKYPLQFSSYTKLDVPFSMANLYRSEPAIDACNSKVLAFLVKAADSRENMDMPALLTRYAYETMIATTTGQSAGFLDDQPEKSIQEIDKTLDDWKFHAVLYGSYLRYHPYITSILGVFGYRGVMSSGLKLLTNDEDTTKARTREIEARVALALAGADPAVSLVFTAIKHIYSRPKLLQKLRDEISQAKLPSPPSFEDLKNQQQRLSSLNAVLLECIRFNQSPSTSPIYTPENEVTVAGKVIPPNSTIELSGPSIHMNPAVFGEDAHSWNPDRWTKANPSIKSQLLAFNATTEESNVHGAHLLLASKLLVQTLPVDIGVCPSGHFYVSAAPPQHLRQSDTSRATDSPAVTTSGASEVEMPSSPRQGLASKWHAFGSKESAANAYHKTSEGYEEVKKKLATLQEKAAASPRQAPEFKETFKLRKVSSQAPVTEAEPVAEAEAQQCQMSESELQALPPHLRALAKKGKSLDLS